MKLKIRFLLFIFAGILYLTHYFLQVLTNIQNNDETNFKFIKIPIYNQDKDIVLIKLINKLSVSHKNSENKTFSFNDLFKILESNNVILIDIETLRRMQTSTIKITELASITFGFVPKVLSEINILNRVLFFLNI